MQRHVRAALISLLVLGTLACREATESQPIVRPLVGTVAEGTLTLPNRATSVKFAVIGDSGRGNRPQHDVAAQMLAFHERFPYAFVLMLGDNIYEGPATTEDYRKKFEEPYRALLDEGIKFYAVLGNHDDPLQVRYPLFNMDGERYYSFAPPEDVLTTLMTRVEFFALDSTYLDRDQLRWAEDRLAASHATWKICFFHHPLYTSGRYRLSSRAFRILEPLLVDMTSTSCSPGTSTSTSERARGGIQYFVTGGAGSLRPGDGGPASHVARTFASDYHFMLIEIDGRELHFQAISRSGRDHRCRHVVQGSARRARAEHAVATQRDMPVRR